MHVVPAPGLSIPDPSQRGTPGYFLPAEGREVAPDSYWVRRLRDGDVSLGATPAPAAAAADPLTAEQHLARAAAELAAAAGKPASA